MATVNEDAKNQSDARPLTIREVAERLGVSERTVYRRLRSGQLHHDDLLKMSVTRDSVSATGSRNIPSNNVSIKSTQELENDILSDGVSVTMTVKRLTEEIREKDAQIKKLLDVQSDLSHTLQKVQEQMFELARLVLVQNTHKSADPVAADRSGEIHGAEEKQGLFTRLFGSRDKESKS